MASGRNEIAVELRLLLNKLGADIAKATSQIRAGMNAGMGVGGKSPVKKAMEEAEVATRKTTKAVRDQRAELEAWKKSLPAPVITDASGSRSTNKVYGPGATIKMTGTGLASSAMYSEKVKQAQKEAVRQAADTTAWWRQHFAQLVNPNERLTGDARQSYKTWWEKKVPPNIPKAQPQAPTTLWSMLSGAGNTPLSAVGAGIAKVAAGLTVFRVALGLVKFAIDLVVEPLKKAAAWFRSMADDAKRMYGKALTSGSSLGMISHYSLMSQVLGISETDVMKMAGSFRYLSQQVAFAAGAYRSTSVELASASVELSLLKADLSALGLLLANEFSPGIRKLVADIRIAIELLGPIISKLGGMAGKSILGMIAGPVLNAIGKGVIALSPDNKLPSPNAMMPGRGGGMGFTAWEKMGLVIGRNPGNTAAERTASNTAKTASLLGQLVTMMGRSGGAGAGGSWGNIPIEPSRTKNSDGYFAPNQNVP